MQFTQDVETFDDAKYDDIAEAAICLESFDYTQICILRMNDSNIIFIHTSIHIVRIVIFRGIHTQGCKENMINLLFNRATYNI
jgi:hypothetical protein